MERLLTYVYIPTLHQSQTELDKSPAGLKAKEDYLSTLQSAASAFLCKYRTGLAMLHNKT